MKISNRFKKPVLFLLIALFSACNTGELENKIAELEAEKIESTNDLVDKEELIVDFISSLNEIENNLAEIKERENVITSNFQKGNMEINNNIKDQIMGDIDLINNLLLENRVKMTALNSKLKKAEQASNIKIKGLEKMIEGLAVRMQQKDGEIATLHTQLAEANQQLMVLFEEYNLRIKELGKQENKLNTAYYCYGSAKELKEQGVISKKGGFIGIGKTAKLSEDFNKKYFTQVDIRMFNHIDLMSEKVKVVTNHPTDSYQIEGEDGKAEKLVILDSDEFWSSSKFLVLVVE
jgi:DNA repair exonuclease SbcCD ATPase subunit